MSYEIVYVVKESKPKLSYTVYESGPDGFLEYAQIYSVERDGVHTIILNCFDNRVSNLTKDLDNCIAGNAIGEKQLERKMREVVISVGIQKARSRNGTLLIGCLEGMSQLSKLVARNHEKNFALDKERLKQHYKKPKS
jgi:hypothetical protein